MIKVIVSLLIAVSVAGCSESPEVAALRVNPEVSNIGTFEDCEVKYVNRGYESNSFYIARCPGTTTTATRTYSVQQGKTRIQKRSTVIAQEIEQLKAQKVEADQRELALEKLTPAEKQLLGVN